MKKRVIFLDRDGVINKDPGGWTEHGYVTRPEDFYFLPGSLEALKLLKENEIDVIVVSNQAGVSRGLFSEADLHDVNEKMLEEVGAYGGRIKEAYYCVHKEADNCNCRKPKTGLFEDAIKKYGIDIAGAYFIGDGERDIVAGKRAGIKTILVLSGKSSREDLAKWEEKPDRIFKDLLEAVRWITGSTVAGGNQ